MVIRIGLIASSFLFYACENPSVVETKKKETEISGEKIYLKYCISCHGDNGKLGVSGSKDLTLSKLDSLAIDELIKEGKNGMPQFKNIITSDKELAKLTDFVLSLRKQE